MIGFPSPMFAKADGPPPVIGPLDPATLFTAGDKGAYYNFTDGATLAINADGTGGVPAIGGACRSVLDLSPNANRLRNTVSSVTRRAGGIETDGIGYGLFNATGVGDWPWFPQPYEILLCFEQIAFAGTDARIMQTDNGIAWFLLQGSASGKVRFYDSTYGTEVDPGIGTERVIDGYFNSGLSSIALDGGSMQASLGYGNDLRGIYLGSTAGGGASTQCRFKHLLVIGRGLTSAERTGVVQWMQA